MTLASSDITTRCHTVVSDELIGSDRYILFTNIDHEILKSHRKPRLGTSAKQTGSFPDWWMKISILSKEMRE